MTYDFSELDRFEERLNDAPRRMSRIGIQITDDSAKRMVSHSKRVVRRRTGALQEDIRVIRKGSYGDEQVGAEFGVDSDRRGLVGIVIEKGFRHYQSGQFIGPFPYLMPGYEAHARQWKDRIVKAAVDLIVK